VNRWRKRLTELQGARAQTPSAVRVDQNVQNVQNPPPGPTSEQFEQFERPANVEADLANIWCDTEEERAAIIEHEGGIPREWADALARIDRARPPPDISPRRWQVFLSDVDRFVQDGWPVRAAAEGWRPVDIFGFDGSAPLVRVNRRALLWRQEGLRLLSLAAGAVTVESASGAHETYRRRQFEDGVEPG
jgi:hypothetical protein